MKIVITPEEWLAALPTERDGFDAWLEVGQPLWDDPEDMGRAIKQEAWRQIFANDLPRSERLARALVRHGEIERLEGLVALGEMALGDALRLQRRLDEGYALLDRAAERFERLGDELGWARTRIGWLGHIQHRPESPPLDPTIERAAAIFERHEGWDWLVMLSHNYATYFAYRGLPERQLDWILRGFRAATRLESADRRRFILTHSTIMLVDVYNDLGRYDEAQRATDRLLRRLDDPALGEVEGLRVEALRVISRFFLDTGRYTQALYHLTHARELAANDEQLFTITLLQAETERHLNRLDRTEALLRELLARTDGAAEWALMEYNARLLLSRVLGSQDRWEEALAVLVPALEAMEARQDRSVFWLSMAYQQQARALLRLERREGLNAVVERATELADQSGVDAIIAQAQMLAARVAPEGEARDAALVAAWEVSRDLPWLRWRVSRLAAALGDHPVARRRALEQAADDLDTVQGSLVASAHADFLADAETLYQELIAAYLREDEVELAWQTLERAKSRALVNMLSFQGEESPVASSRRTAELARLQVRHYAALRGQLEGRTGADEVRAIEVEITALQEALEVEMMGRREPLSPPRPIVPRAAPRSDLIGYYLVGEETHGFVHNGEQYAHVRLPATPSQLQGLLTALFMNMETLPQALDWFEPLMRQAEQILDQLDELLLAPLRPYLRHDRLVLVPHGLLHQTPFHLLRHGGRYLLESTAVRVVPTARLALRRHEQEVDGEGRSVIFCHSWEGRLPNAIEEAHLIARILGSVQIYAGREATWEALVEAMADARLIHIAAHGQHRPDAPHFSHIQLDDAQFCASDLLHLSLRASLVTLSACETGQVVVRAGDDPVGLWRGFLAAGARSLLVSLWKLEDQATLELMGAYYSRLAAGMDKVAALRAIQVDWLNRAEEHHRHPFYWGGLQLIGDDGPL